MNFLRKLFSLKESQSEVHTSAKAKVQIPPRVKNMDELEHVFEVAGLEQLFPKISPFVKHKLEISTQPAEEDQLTLGQSKIGGLPDLPPIVQWPKSEEGKSLSFIGQIHLSEVSMYECTKLLPKTGLLSFFYCADQEAWGI